MNAREKPFANKLRTRIKMSTTSASCIFSMVIRSLIQMRACVLYFKLFYGFNKVMRTTYNIARMVFQPIRLQTREIRIKIAFGVFRFRLKCFSSRRFHTLRFPWIFWLEFKLFAAIYSERKTSPTAWMYLWLWFMAVEIFEYFWLVIGPGMRICMLLHIKYEWISTWFEY